MLTGSNRYITGVAVCLAIDLGLHQEDSDDADDADALDSDKTAPRETTSKGTNSEHGRSQWTRDLRRRLWWCTYTFDRLVSTCVGRPFGINEHAITTELPSLLDDDYITESGFIEPPHANGPSYKHASHHHFRLHLLQSEIVQVLQFNQGKVARAAKKRRNYSAQTNTPCPFIAHFDSFGSWLVDMEKRLHLWRASTPTSEETGVAYSTLFLELGYWQAVILLHGKRGSNPALKKALYRKQNGRKADRDEDTDQSHLKVAEAGQKVIRLYRQLHLQGLIRYTYISTHQLFVAGMSYLEAIHSSETLRGRVVSQPCSVQREVLKLTIGAIPDLGRSRLYSSGREIGVRRYGREVPASQRVPRRFRSNGACNHQDCQRHVKKAGGNRPHGTFVNAIPLVTPNTR